MQQEMACKVIEELNEVKGDEVSRNKEYGEILYTFMNKRRGFKQSVNKCHFFTL